MTFEGLHTDRIPSEPRRSTRERSGEREQSLFITSCDPAPPSHHIYTRSGSVCVDAPENLATAYAQAVEGRLPISRFSLFFVSLVQCFMSFLAVTAPSVARLGDLKAALTRLTSISTSSVLALSIVLARSLSPISSRSKVATYLDPDVLTNLDRPATLCAHATRDCFSSLLKSLLMLSSVYFLTSSPALGLLRHAVAPI